MKTAKLQALQKQVSQYTKHRQNILADIRTKRTRYTWGVSFLLTLFIFLIEPTYGGFSANSWKPNADNIVALLWTLSALFGAMMLYTQTLAPPDNKQDVDEWLWKRGRNYAIFLFLTLFTWTISLSLPVDFHAYHNREFVLISVPAFTLYPISVLLVLWKPRLFMSRWLGVLGGGGFYFFAGTTSFRLFSLVSDIKAIPAWLMGLLALPLIFRWTFLVVRQLTTHKLDLIQLERVMHFTNFDRVSILAG